MEPTAEPKVRPAPVEEAPRRSNRWTRAADEFEKLPVKEAMGDVDFISKIIGINSQEAAPVLSYAMVSGPSRMACREACTCTAVAQHLGVSEAQARDLADSSSGFARHFEPQVWQALQERSLAIEKANKEKQREAERRKQEKALAKAVTKNYKT